MARLIPLYSKSSEAEIRRRAQRRFEFEDCQPGHELDHWLEAEAEFREHAAETTASPTVENPPAMIGGVFHRQIQL